MAGQLGQLAGVVVCLAGSSRALRRMAEARARLAACDGVRWTQALAEIHASAQPGILECDWSHVVAACQGTSRDALKARAAWLAEAREALAEAVEEWAALARWRAEAAMAA